MVLALLHVPQHAEVSEVRYVTYEERYYSATLVLYVRVYETQAFGGEPKCIYRDELWFNVPDRAVYAAMLLENFL